MKIPIDFSPNKDRISLICSVRFAPKNLPLPIKFVVDTGSPETFIDEIDLLRFRIQAQSYPYSNDMLMAGTKVALHKIGKSAIGFRDASNNLQNMTFDSLKVARTAWTRKGAVSAGTSILGMNFLISMKMHLFVDPANDTAFISDGKNQ